MAAMAISLFLSQKRRLNSFKFKPSPASRCGGDIEPSAQAFHSCPLEPRKVSKFEKKFCKGLEMFKKVKVARVKAEDMTEVRFHAHECITFFRTSRYWQGWTGSLCMCPTLQRFVSFPNFVHPGTDSAGVAYKAHLFKSFHVPSSHDSLRL